jgi:hypothetical protein
MVRTFIFEFLITAPCLIAIAFICVKLLQKDIQFANANRTAGIISAGLILAVMVARAMPFLSFKVVPPRDLAAEQTNALNRKNEFMKILDQLVANQSQLNAEVKKKVFEEYKDLFPNGAKDKQVYYQNLATFVDCNIAYFEDAKQALKTKKNQKSEKRQKCQEMDGMFFNRAKLVPPEQAKVNDQVIETIAKGKKIVEDNKEVQINEGILQQALENQNKSLETLKIIFAEGP